MNTCALFTMLLLAWNPMKSSSGVPLRHGSTCIFLTPAGGDSDNLESLLYTNALSFDEALIGLSALQFFIDEPDAFSDDIGVNSVYFITDSWNYEPSADAMTILTWIDDPGGSEDGIIVDADILINDTDGRFSLNQDSTRLQRVLIHEMGHAAGLDHPCRLLGTEDSSLPFCTDTGLDEIITRSIMYPFSGVENLIPNNDDISGFATLYPMNSDFACERYEPPGDEGCSCSSLNLNGKHNPWVLAFFTVCLIFIRKKYRLP
ncbi:hypothetical protein KKF34_07835 [Myxococcota bacterium]|nr:hypothetical protein [Myxococcota bacterium]MBU1382857.1 hypothetical protein [Myxococcota bacterium]MBU1496771.1 hypothetical protein [Myxococcota bacterium]